MPSCRLPHNASFSPRVPLATRVQPVQPALLRFFLFSLVYCHHRRALCAALSTCAPALGLCSSSLRDTTRSAVAIIIAIYAQCACAGPAMYTAA
eukprot:scaffold3801_cov124-Isochrysis_galbana.AAC.14